MRGCIFTASLLLMACCAAYAAESVDAHLDVTPKEIPWHKTVTFSIVVDAPPSAEISIDNMAGHFGGLEVSGGAEIKTTIAPDGRKRTTQTYILEAPKAEPGKFQPDPVVVRVKGGDTISLPSPEIRVRNLTPEEEAQAQKFVESLAPLNVPKHVWEYWQFWAGIAAAAALAVIAFVAYRWYTRQRREMPRPVAPPWVTALARLSALEAKKWRETGKLEAYYIELSAILRHYIEDRFDIRAPERTTPEFLAEASNSGVLSDEHQRMLAALLRYSDRVKFAKYEPTADDAVRNHEDVKRFVEETVPAINSTEAAA